MHTPSRNCHIPFATNMKRNLLFVIGDLSTAHLPIFQSALAHMSSSISASAAPFVQIDEHQYEFPGPIDEDGDDQPYTLITDGSMSFKDVRDFFTTLRHVERPPSIQPQRFVTVSHRIKINDVVAAKWTDNEYYPAIVLRQCGPNMFAVKFLADGIEYMVHTRSIKMNPKFGMCRRDQRIWATGRVNTFDGNQYTF